MQRSGFRPQTSGERFFRCLAKSETLTKRHVDRTRKLDPGACASQRLPNALAQAPIIAEPPPHVHLRSLRPGDSGWSTVHEPVGIERVQVVTVQREGRCMPGARLWSTIACRRCDGFICKGSPGSGISSGMLPSHKRRILRGVTFSVPSSVPITCPIDLGMEAWSFTMFWSGRMTVRNLGSDTKGGHVEGLNGMSDPASRRMMQCEEPPLVLGTARSRVTTVQRCGLPQSMSRGKTDERPCPAQ